MSQRLKLQEESASLEKQFQCHSKHETSIRNALKECMNVDEYCKHKATKKKENRVNLHVKELNAFKARIAKGMHTKVLRTPVSLVHSKAFIEAV